MKFNPASFRPSKRLVAIIIAVLILAGLLTYAVFSYAYWQSYTTRGSQAAASLKTQIDTSFTPESKTAPHEAITQVLTDFEHRNGSEPCQIDGWYRWQTIIPALKVLETRCNERLSDSLVTVDALKRLSAYLGYQQATAAALTEAIKATASPKDYTAAARTWQTTADSNALSDNASDFLPVTKTSRSSAAAIARAFTSLAAADKKEDEDAFDKASSDLKKAFESIKGVKVQEKTTYQQLIVVFIQAYEKL